MQIQSYPYKKTNFTWHGVLSLTAIILLAPFSSASPSQKDWSETLSDRPLVQAIVQSLMPKGSKKDLPEQSSWLNRHPEWVPLVNRHLDFSYGEIQATQEKRPEYFGIFETVGSYRSPVQRRVADRRVQWLRKESRIRHDSLVYQVEERHYPRSAGPIYIRSREEIYFSLLEQDHPMTEAHYYIEYVDRKTHKVVDSKVVSLERNHANSAFRLYTRNIVNDGKIRTTAFHVRYFLYTLPTHLFALETQGSSDQEKGTDRRSLIFSMSDQLYIEKIIREQILAETALSRREELKALSEDFDLFRPFQVIQKNAQTGQASVSTVGDWKTLRTQKRRISPVFEKRWTRLGGSTLSATVLFGKEINQDAETSVRLLVSGDQQEIFRSVMTSTPTLLVEVDEEKSTDKAFFVDLTRHSEESSLEKALEQARKSRVWFLNVFGSQAIEKKKINDFDGSAELLKKVSTQLDALFERMASLPESQLNSMQLADGDIDSISEWIQKVPNFLTRSKDVELLGEIGLQAEFKETPDVLLLYFFMEVSRRSIPIIPRFGYVYDQGEDRRFKGHVWFDVFLDGKWVLVDPLLAEMGLNSRLLRLPINVSDEFEPADFKMFRNDLKIIDRLFVGKGV